MDDKTFLKIMGEIVGALEFVPIFSYSCSWGSQFSPPITCNPSCVFNSQWQYLF